MPLQLRTATKDDVPALGRVASKAFHPSIDPIASRLFPPHLRSPKQDIDGILAFRKARKAIVVDDTEHLAVKVVVDDELNGQIVGVAVWELPRDVAAGSAEVGKSKPQAAAPTPPPEMDQDAVGVVKSTLANDAVEALGEDGVAHVYHLQLIAVDPAQQKRGIGRILVNWGVQQADERAKKCYLFASEAGRRLYQAVGFEVVKEVPVFGFPHYSMIRQPAETSS